MRCRFVLRGGERMPDQRYIRRPWETQAGALGDAPSDAATSDLGQGTHDHVLGEPGDARLRDADEALAEYPPRFNPEESQAPPAAGWYDDPAGAGIRYWSGSGWTDQVAAKPAKPPSLAPTPVRSSTPLGRWLQSNWKWLLVGAGALIIGAGAGAA